MEEQGGSDEPKPSARGKKAKKIGLRIPTSNVASQFPDMPYEEGNAVKVTGPRGAKILVIHKKFKNGKYQLKDGDMVQQKLYDEADLSLATSLK